MRCGKHMVCMCYFEGKKNLKYKKTQKPTFNQWGMAPDSEEVGTSRYHLHARAPWIYVY